MSNTAAALLMAALFVVVIGIDIWLALDRRVGNTYSERLRAWGRAWPPVRLLVVFSVGLLCGHWFWSPVEYVEVPCAPSR